MENDERNLLNAADLLRTLRSTYPGYLFEICSISDIAKSITLVAYKDFGKIGHGHCLMKRRFDLDKALSEKDIQELNKVFT